MTNEDNSQILKLSTRDWVWIVGTVCGIIIGMTTWVWSLHNTSITSIDKKIERLRVEQAADMKDMSTRIINRIPAPETIIKLQTHEQKLRNLELDIKALEKEIRELQLAEARREGEDGKGQ